MAFRTMSSSLASVLLRERGGAAPMPDHVVDQLIAERAINLSRHPMWPVLRPLLYRCLHYDKAVAMADEIATMSGWDAFVYLSDLLSLDITIRGIENIPTEGAFILAPCHPTGIADGIAIFDLLKSVRPDMAFFANRDVLRVSAQFSELTIPVEWRPGEKSHSKSRDTLELTARAFAAGKAIVLFPSGRIAFWSDGKLTERPWQNSIVALARRFRAPIVPAHMTARNSGLFYLLSRYSTELRDMTVFHELLNKKTQPFTITLGKQIEPELLEGDASEVTALLQKHTVERLAADPAAVFAGNSADPATLRQL